MASLIDACILQAVEAATDMEFKEEDMEEERLRLPTRMKGGGIKKQTDLMRPTFLGALPNILPRCIDITETGVEENKGYYSKQLKIEIGEGAYNHDGHKNARYLESSRLGPYPSTCRHAWEHLRLDAVYNYGLNILSSPED